MAKTERKIATSVVGCFCSALLLASAVTGRHTAARVDRASWRKCEFTLRYSFDVFNVTNTPNFDIAIDNLEQNQYYNDLPVQGALPALRSGCGRANEAGGFYNSPFGMGNVDKTIVGAPQMQTNFSLKF